VARSSIATIIVCLGVLACSQSPRDTPASDTGDAGAAAGIDSLNARLVQAYRSHDPKMYGTLYTDTAVFEWPAFNTVRGRAGLEAMARDNWAALADMDLKLNVSARRLAPNHATEFGAFEQSWRDAKGGRMTEYGRYVAFLVRDDSAGWRIDRFAGFSDSTRPAPAAR
jgi:ketosteroid isomerase-like protein